MRCPDCNKFVGLETQEPEEQDTPEVDDNGVAHASFRLARTCAECSNELKETTFELEGELVPDKEGDDITKCSNSDPDGEEPIHSWEHDSTDSEPTESGGGRYAKNMIGVKATVHFKCSNCSVTAHVELEDAAPASSFDELV